VRRRRIRRAVPVGVLTIGMGLTACSTPTAGRTADAHAAVAVTTCHVPLHPVPVLAVTERGSAEWLDPATLGVIGTLTTSVLPDLGIALLPQLDMAYVTAPGTDGKPALWAHSLTDCHRNPVMVERDAELPSVSPDGGFLGFVTLDGDGRQTGVGITALGRAGEPTGTVRRYRASSTPPPLPITGVAVAPRDGELAVWGGFVDPYLGRAHPTVGTLDPSTARSLAALAPVFDAQGMSDAAGASSSPGHTVPEPEDWQAAPAYLPDGYLLVGDASAEISMPFTDTTPGVDGGGIRTIVHDTGSIVSLAAGNGGAVAFVRTDGTLTLAVGAVDLPFGPAADTAPGPPPTERSATGRFTAVAWTAGTGTQTPVSTRVFRIVPHLPDFVGLSLPAATAALDLLDLPSMVGRTVVDDTVPAGTVLAQDPAAGTGMACQCTVTLTVSSRG